jgi:hypothetical protein
MEVRQFLLEISRLKDYGIKTSEQKLVESSVHVLNISKDYINLSMQDRISVTLRGQSKTLFFFSFYTTF